MSKHPTDARGRLESDPFDYRATRNALVSISRGGRVVVTLGGPSAQRLLSALAAADDRTKQLVLAKATGNYKHGNERLQR